MVTWRESRGEDEVGADHWRSGGFDKGNILERSICRRCTFFFFYSYVGGVLERNLLIAIFMG